MPAIENALIADTGWTTINCDGSIPPRLDNASDTTITVRFGGTGDTRSILPGAGLDVPAGAAVEGSHTGTGDKLIQVLRAIVPKSVSKGGGAVAAAGAIAAGDGRGRWSVGQDDFTAAYLSADELTLGTFPSAMGTPVSGDFSMVIVTDKDGVQRAYFPTANAFVLTAQVLKVTGAVFLTGGSADKGYDVVAWGPPRSYDASTNADQVYPLTIPRSPQDSPQQSASGLGDGTTHKYFDVEQGRDFTNRILDTPGSAGDNTYTLHTSQLNDGEPEATSDYQDRTLELVGQATVTTADIAADPSIGVWQLNGIQAKRIRITCERANDGANTDGAYQYDAMWS